MNRTFFAFAMQHFSLIDLKTFRAVADEGNQSLDRLRPHQRTRVKFGGASFHTIGTGYGSNACRRNRAAGSSSH